MTISRLREIAALHTDLSAYALKKSRSRRQPSAQEVDARMAEYHAAVAKDLTELANAFAALSPLLPSQK